MGEPVCPHCNAVLPPHELAEGWCETCGKQIPAFVRGHSPPRPSADVRPPFRYAGASSSVSVSGRPLASREARLGAVVVDSVVGCLAFVPAWSVFALMPQDDHTAETVGPLLALAGLAVVSVVQIILLSVSGQTVGKKLLRVRIVNHGDDGNPGFVGAVLLRQFIPGLIAGIPCVGVIFAVVDVLYIFSDDRRCVHDLIAGTKVVQA